MRMKFYKFYLCVAVSHYFLCRCHKYNNKMNLVESVDDATAPCANLYDAFYAGRHKFMLAQINLCKSGSIYRETSIISCAAM